MSLLTITQQFCSRTGLPSPNTVVGTTDELIDQIRALIEEEGNDLSKRGGWSDVIFEASHTTVALEDQGAMSTIASNGFSYIVNNTIWDRTDKLPVIGPENAETWQGMKAMTSVGPKYSFRIRGGHLLVNPAPTAGHSWYFEYVSKNWITDAAGTAYRQYFSLDTDVCLLPEELVLQGLRWRWKKEKGLDYAEDFRTYEAQAKDAIGRNGGKQTISMDTGTRARIPGIFVPSGSWI